MSYKGRKRPRQQVDDDGYSEPEEKESFSNDQAYKDRVKKRQERDAWKEKRRPVEQIVANYKNLAEVDPSTIHNFSDLPLSDATIAGLKESKYVTPTAIQRESLPFSLTGSDVVGAAKTGSGKTLALVIPLIECLWRNRWSREDGLGAMVISPTRELALQTFNTINKVGKHHDFSVCLLIGGGTDIEFEKTRLYAMNIIICTPGRMLQHLDENADFNADSLQVLVIDEADRILDMGFSEQINTMVEYLPRSRQTLLFSATQTKNVKDLGRVCTTDPVFVSVHEKSATATPDQLKQLYLVCEEEQKINTLWSFITNHRRAKTLVFVTTCKQARYLTQAFTDLNPGVSLLGLWGTMKQSNRIEVFQKFDRSQAGVLIATDLAGRGLDFNGVQWVVQMDAPSDVDDYIHRVGRTARMENRGQALLVLTPTQEEAMTNLLSLKSIPVSKMEVDPRSLKNIRPKLQQTLARHTEIHTAAQRAFVAFIRSIYVQRNKEVFNVKNINTKALAESMGLVTVPRLRYLNRQGIHLNGEDDGGEEEDEEDLKRGYKVQEEELVKAHGFGDEIDDMREDELFSLKKKTKQEKLEEIAREAKQNVKKEEDEEDDETEVPETSANGATGSQFSKKLKTREELARKMLKKKNVVVNTKKMFDDEGEKVVEVEGVGEIAQSDGLNLEEAIREKLANDARDKKAHKERQLEKKRLLKLKYKGKTPTADSLDLGGGGSGSDGEDGERDDLSWLPRPEGFDSDEDDDLPAQYDPSLDDLLEAKKNKSMKKKKVVKEDEGDEDDEALWKALLAEGPVKKKKRKVVKEEEGEEDDEALWNALLAEGPVKKKKKKASGVDDKGGIKKKTKKKKSSQIGTEENGAPTIKKKKASQIGADQNGTVIKKKKKPIQITSVRDAESHALDLLNPF